MRKLSEIEGDDALDILADLIDPVCEIVVDQDVVTAFTSGDRMRAIKLGLKKHKKAVTTIIALLNEKDPATYRPSLLTLPAMLMELLEDEALMGLFSSQSQTEKTSFGDATENTEAEEK